MKTLLIAASGLALLAGAAQAQPYDRHEEHREAQAIRHEEHREAQAAHHAAVAERHWARGQRLPREYWGGGYVVNDWRVRHLRPPPRGYHWVRVDNNYMLAAVTTGLIADIIASSR